MDENKLAEAIVEAMRRSEEERVTRAGSPEAKVEASLKAEAARREEFAKELVKLNKVLKDTSSASKTFERVINNQRAAYRNIDTEIETLTEQYNNSREALERADISKKRSDLEAAKNAQNLSSAISNASLGFIKLSNTLGTLAVGAAGDFVKGLQRGSSGIELSAGLMTAGVDAVNSGIQGAATGLGGLGQIAQTSTNPRIKALGLAAQGAGLALGFIGEKSSKLAKFGIEVLSTEITKTSDAFNRSSSAGAVFADGMSGLRNAATLAGLRIDQFAAVISKQSEVMAQSGLGVTETAKMMGRVGQVLKNQKLDVELLRLGFGFQEQMELVSEVMADMRKGQSGLLGDPEGIAKGTREYAANLRTVANITGEDARAKMTESRRLASQAAFRVRLQELEAKQPGITQQILLAMNSMSDPMKNAVMQQMTLNTVMDQGANIMISSNKGFADAVYGTVEQINSGRFSLKENQVLQGRANDEFTKSLNRGSVLFDIGIAGVANKLPELNSSISKQIETATKVTEKAVMSAQDNIDKLPKTPNDLTGSFTDAQVEAQNFALALQNKILPMIEDFAKISEKLLKEVDEMLGDFTKEIKEGKAAEAQQKRDTGDNFWDKNKRSMVRETVGLASGLAAGVATSPAALTGVGAAGTLLSAGAGYMSGKQLFGDALNEWFFGKEGKARGGIASGPKSGFIEKLHGTEAVVPLPDGRTIPVKIEGNVREKQEAGGFDFTKVLSGVADSFSRVGAAFKKSVMIDDRELAAAFAANKPDLTDANKQQKLAERKPTDKAPGVLESLISATTSSFRNLTRDFVAAKDEVKTTKEKEFAGLTKQVADLSTTVDGTAKAPTAVATPTAVEINKQDIAQLADATRTRGDISLSDQAVAELKDAQKASSNLLINEIGTMAKSDSTGQLVDSLSRSINKPDGLKDETVTSLIDTIRTMSSTRELKIEIKDLESLNQLSATMLAEQTRPKEVGSEQCSALMAKYVEQSKNQTVDLNKKFEDVSKQLLGSKEINKAGPTDMASKTTTTESNTAVDRLTSIGDSMTEAIRAGFESRNAMMTGELTSLITELKDSLLQKNAQSAVNTDTLPKSDEIISTTIQNAMREGNNALREALVEQADLMRAHLVKIDQLVSISSDTKNINQALLNNAY